MLFNTFQFAIFLAIVLAAHRAVPRERRASVLLVASLVFYTVWIPAYLLLMLVDVGVNYALLRAMIRSRRPRFILGCSIAFTSCQNIIPCTATSIAPYFDNSTYCASVQQRIQTATAH